MMETSIITSWLIWFLLGIGLALLELILPGFIMIFFALGCWVTALVLFFFDIPLTGQLLTFMAATLLSLLLLRKSLMRVFQGQSSEASRDFDDFPRGMRVPVTRTITPEGGGRIQYRGTTWDAVADESIEAGATVEIVRYADNSRQVFFVRTVHS